MARLADQIREAIREERYLIGAHAASRLDERAIMDWQVVNGTLGGRLERERPNDQPWPVAEFVIELPDGTPAKAVWSWIAELRIAKLVTVHHFDE